MQKQINDELQFLDVAREGMADKNDSELRAYILSCFRARRGQLEEKLQTTREVENECEKLVNSKLY